MHRTEGTLAPEVWALTTSVDEFQVLIHFSHSFLRIENKKQCELFPSGDVVTCFKLAVFNAHISLVAYVATILGIANSSHLLLFFSLQFVLMRRPHVISIYKTTTPKVTFCTKITHGCFPAIIFFNCALISRLMHSMHYSGN